MTGNEKLKALSREHLFYEFQMMFCCAKALSRPITDVFFKNILIESFVIHAAILSDFFYKNSRESDAVFAGHYVKSISAWKKDRPKKSAMLNNVNQRRNKECAHLSYDRLKVVVEEKPWDVQKIKQELNEVLDVFLEHIDGEKFDFDCNRLKAVM